MSTLPKDDGSEIRFVKETSVLPIPHDLESWLPTNHLARTIKAFVAKFDFSIPYSRIKSRGSNGGRPAIDPRTLAALWLYAYRDGITCSRKLEEACRVNFYYAWLSGCTQPNHKTLSDFRSKHPDFIFSLFQQFNRVLIEQGLLSLDEVTIDGRRVKANASRDSFHRKPTLDNHLQETQEHLKKLNQPSSTTEQTNQSEEQLSNPTSEQPIQSQAEKSAQKRAATEKYERIQKAQKVRDKRAQDREESQRRDENKSYTKPEETRASETDADARKMKFCNGGYSPAYNVQTMVDTENGFIAGTLVSDEGNDSGLLDPVVEKIESEFEETTGKKKKIERVIVDGGYSNKKHITKLENRGTEVYTPPRGLASDKKKEIDPYKKKKSETRIMGRVRERMGEEESKRIYGKRAPIAEGVHAHQRNRGFTQMRLRGLKKVELETCLQALSYNLDLFHRLASKRRANQSNGC